jgi:hypothetical protein
MSSPAAPPAAALMSTSITPLCASATFAALSALATLAAITGLTAAAADASVAGIATYSTLISIAQDSASPCANAANGSAIPVASIPIPAAPIAAILIATIPATTTDPPRTGLATVQNFLENLPRYNVRPLLVLQQSNMKRTRILY